MYHEYLYLLLKVDADGDADASFSLEKKEKWRSSGDSTESRVVFGSVALLH